MILNMTRATVDTHLTNHKACITDAMAGVLFEWRKQHGSQGSAQQIV